MNASTAVADTTGLFVVAAAPAGWYDQTDGSRRWFDGRQWTDHFAPQLRLVPDLRPERTHYATDHGFHVIMVVMTLGVWAPVWAAVGCANVLRSAVARA